MYKKFYLIPIIALILTSFPVSAASPSPVPSDNTTAINENLKKRLQESLSTDDTTLSNTQTNRGFIGKIKDIIKDTIIMEDKDGQKDIKISDSTTIVRTPGSATIKPEDMRLGDYIIAIGSPSGDEVLDAKRIIVSIDPIQTSSKSSGLGTISKIGKSTLTLQVEGSNTVVTVTSKTLYKSTVGLIESTDLELGDTLVYTTTKNEDDTLTATVIMRVKTAALGE